jgi:hypothetical protein
MPDGLELIAHGNQAPMALEDTNHPELTLLRGLSLLKKSNLDVFIHMGTALGFFRDGDFIPDDTDVDVAVLADFDHYKHLLRIPDRMRALLQFEPIRTMKYEGRPMQYAFRDPQNSAIFDIYFLYLDMDPGQVTNVNTYGFMRYPRKLFEEPCVNFKTKYGPMPALSEMEAYLEYHYGDDWRIPRAGYKGLYWKGTAS